MPNHKTHDKVGVIGSIPISIAAYYLHFTNVTGSIALGIGIVASTLFLSPDLDLYSRVYLRWGLLRWIWLPYQKLIHHRSWISHSGPISATIKLIYLGAWILPILYLLHVPELNLTYNPLYAILWIAVMIADSLHVFMDLVWKDKK